jgi:hypothetical protein
MELATCMVALGGDIGQTVPKYNVTPAEVAVLRLIHGTDAITDVVVTATVNRTSSVERSRLVSIYGKGVDGELRSPAVDALFPGVAARLFDSFKEIDLLDAEADSAETEVITPIEVVVPVEKSKNVRAKKTSETVSGEADSEVLN